GADGDKLQDAWVAVAIDHAPCAAVTNELRFIEFVDVAHRPFPEVTTVKIEVPIEVEVFVAAKAPELFAVLAQMPLHFSERFGRIDHGKPAALLHLLDFLKNLQQLVGFVVYEAGIAEAQVAGSKTGQRITEGAAFEAQFGQKSGQLIVIVNQLAG